MRCSASGAHSWVPCQCYAPSKGGAPLCKVLCAAAVDPRATVLTHQMSGAGNSAVESNREALLTLSAAQPRDFHSWGYVATSESM